MKIKIFTNALAALTFFAVLNLPVAAQTEDADPFFNPHPETGMWFPNDGSGTGIILEVQADIMVGALFGADASGDNTWLLFSGELVPRINAEIDQQVGWMLDTTLFRTTGSACIVDCPPGENAGAPVTTEAGQITLEFIGRSAATFRVDDAPAKPIAPFYFGVLARRTDPDNALEAMPDLTGTWLLVSDMGDDDKDVTGGVAIARIGHPDITLVQTESGVKILQEIVYPVEFSSSLTRQLTCKFERKEEHPEEPPRCFMDPGFAPIDVGTVDFYDISDSRFTVFSSSDVVGDITRTDFFRVGYD